MTLTKFQCQCKCQCKVTLAKPVRKPKCRELIVENNNSNGTSLSLTLGPQWPNKLIDVKVVGVDDGNPDPVIVKKRIRTDSLGNFGFEIPATIDRYHAYVCVKLSSTCCIKVRSQLISGIE